MSVASVTELCNLALGRIGANRLVAIDTDGTVQAIQCLLHYPNLRDALLRAHDWGFAKYTLALVDTWATATVYTTDQYVWTPWRGFAIATAVAASDTFTVTSTTDISSLFPVGGTFYVEGTTSGTNDGTYTVITSSWTTPTLTLTVANVPGNHGAAPGNIIIASSTNYLYKCAVAHTASTYFYTDLGASTPKWTVYATRPTGSGYDYQYVHPASYLRLTRYDADFPHYSNQHGYILSDNTAIDIDYVKQITDVTAFTDPLFVEVLVLQLAVRLLSALGLSMSGVAREQLLTELRKAEKLARVIDRQENNNTGTSNWNDARMGIEA